MTQARCREIAILQANLWGSIVMDASCDEERMLAIGQERKWLAVAACLAPAGSGSAVIAEIAILPRKEDPQ